MAILMKTVRLLVWRNKLIKFLYKSILRKIFFLEDPENIHIKMVRFGKILGSTLLTRYFTGLLFSYNNSVLEQNLEGIHFKNPVGLAAGFDKNAELTQIIPSVGFGFEEIGSVTGEKCEGNPSPRLWRLKRSKALVVYYGLKNDGCAQISWRLKNKNFRIPIGISIAKTNSPDTVETINGVKDYVKAFETTKEIGDYCVLNISCPNAFGGQPFTNPDHLEMLLKEIDKVQYDKPLFVKLAPDLTYNEIDQILAICSRHKINGFICTNLTKKRENPKIIDRNVPEKGGISGQPLRDLSDDLIKYVYKKTKGEYIIIGVGGIFCAEDAYRKIKNGANLVQLITGMIYEGPQLISDINVGLVKLLHQDGYKSISEAVGVDV